MSKPDARHLTAELARHGIHDHTVVRGAKHLCVRFTWQGKRRSCWFAGTPGDARHATIELQKLRRMLGVGCVPKPGGSGGRRRRRPARAALPPLPAGFLAAPDPWAALAPLRERMGARP